MNKRYCISIFIIVVLLFGCSSGNKEALEITPLDSFKVDMSSYKEVHSVGHHFVGTSPDELFRCIEEKGCAIFYIGDSSCGNCQEATRLIEEAADELGVTVYYLAAYSKEYPLNDCIDELRDCLYPVLMERNGTKDIYMPFLFTIENGVPVKGYSGLIPDFEDNERCKTRMINIYKDVMKDFA